MKNRSLAPSTRVMVKEVIKADPGYFTLIPVDNEAGNKFEALHMPIVAWALERDTLQPYPITLAGLDVDTPSILRPDGKVERLGQQTFSSVVEWLDDLQLIFKR
jgi:hypothetical protein